jgi:hypothetical protein
MRLRVVGIHQNVARLQIAMDAAFLVGVMQRLGNLCQNGGDLLGAKLGVKCYFFERAPFDVLVDDPVIVAVSRWRGAVDGQRAGRLPELPQEKQMLSPGAQLARRCCINRGRQRGVDVRNGTIPPRPVPGRCTLLGTSWRS